MLCGSYTAGHMGKSKTLSKIKERYMWHGIVNDVLQLVSSLYTLITINNVMNDVPLARFPIVMFAKE